MTFLRTTLPALVLLLLGTEAVAQDCAAGVAIPMRHLAPTKEECVPARVPESGGAAIRARLDRENAALRAELEKELGRYRVAGAAIRLGSDAVDIGRGLPGVKSALSTVPVANEVIGVLKGRAVGYLHERNRESLHATMRNLYAGFVAERPELRGVEFSEQQADFIRFVRGRVAPEDYPVIGASVDEFLVRRVGEIGADLEGLRRHLEPQIAQLQQDGQQVEGRLRDVEGRLLDYEAGRTAFEADVRGAVAEVAATTQTLATVQERILRQQGEILEDVGALQGRVAEAEARINRHNAEIRDLRQRTSLTEVQVARLAELQGLTAQLAAENAQRIDAIGGVLYDNVDAAGKLALVRSGAVAVPEADRGRITQMLERRAEFERRQAELNRYAKGIEVGMGAVAVAQQLGLSGKDAERASDLLTVASVAVGVARAYSGDASGLLTAASGLATLFGKGGSEPDPMQQYLAQQFEQVNLKLDSLSSQVAMVDTKLDSLMVWEGRRHAEVMDQLWFLASHLDAVDRKLDYVIRQVQDAPECVSAGSAFAEDLQHRLRRAASVEALRRLYDNDPLAPELFRCLLRIGFANAPMERGYLHVSDGQQLAVGYPQLTSRSFALGPAPGISLIEGCRSASALDPVSVALLARAVVDMEPVFYFGNNRGEPLPASYFTLDEHRQRQRRMRAIFQTWERVVACSAAQQSLVSGGTLYGEPILNVLQAALMEAGVPQARQAFTRSALESDAGYLRLNLAAQIVRAEFLGTPYAYEALREVEQAAADTAADLPARLARLNGLVSAPNVRFVARPLGRHGVRQVQLEVAAVLLGDSTQHVLPLPPADAIRSREVLYPGILDTLLRLRVDLAERARLYAVSLDLLDDRDAQAALDALFSSQPVTP